MNPDVSDVLLNSQINAELPAEPTPLVFVIGAGPVGTALAARMTRAGVPVAGVHGRDPDLSVAASASSGAMGSSGELPEIFDVADVVVLSVRDARIREVAQDLVVRKRLRREQILLHTSGNWPAGEVLEAARGQVRAIGTLHPLASLTNVERGLPPQSLYGVGFALEGEPAAVEAGAKLVRLMGGQPLVLQGKDLPLYHAAAVIASNYVVVLADLARALLVDAGVPAERAVPALVPLIKSVVVNLADQGLPGALTGPAVRGDVATIEKHLGALEARAPEVLDVYKRLGREALRLAREKNAELSDVAVERLGALFGGLPDVNHKNGVDNVAAEPVGAKKRR